MATHFSYPGTESMSLPGHRSGKAISACTSRSSCRAVCWKWGPASAPIRGCCVIIVCSAGRAWNRMHSLAARLQAAITAEPDAFLDSVEVVVGFVDQLEPTPSYDTILYLDVLEHIEDDAGELLRAALRLAPGGSLIVVSPALPLLFSPFDEAIGHYRRYQRSTLKKVGPVGLDLVRLRYLDSVGLLASLSNRLLLRSAAPSQRQIRFWDRRLVPLSKCLDPLLRYRVGKTIVGIWRRPEAE